jgi:Family of unknown function (DUF5996)
MDLPATRAQWPPLPLAAWQPTYDTLHLWTQIVGKLTLAQCPMVNHFWQVPFHVAARGLVTPPIPYGSRTFEVLFDLVDHNLYVQTSDGDRKVMPLFARSVADFYRELMALLGALGIVIPIIPRPVEIPDPIPFEQDERHASYDRDAVARFFRVLAQVEVIFRDFRGRFIGKSSPVEFYWGTFDLAVSRFSGRRAPPRPSADRILRESYSHELISGGFWPGGGVVPEPAFYAYAAPEPEGFASAPVRPRPAHYEPGLREFILGYDDVRRADDPRAMILDFLQSTYDAGADLGRWDRPALER